MSGTKVEDALSERKVHDDINILLVGETGVGKSTFINSFANYITYKFIDNLDTAQLHVLIPSVFRIRDKNNVEREVSIGSERDTNEYLEIGASATQGVKPYVFGIHEGRTKVRLIDTPGSGDTRGVEQDEINCQNIVGYIKSLGRLNGICFLFKPTNSRLTTHFEYCLWQILCHLDKAACKNIAFIFTNTRASSYGPGDTLKVLEKVVNDVRAKYPDTEIPLDLNRNIFCFDNECFKYVAAVKNNIQFEEDARDRYKTSWEKSTKQCWSLLRYLNNDPNNPLYPYIPVHLMAVNMARNVVSKMAPILSETVGLIESSNFALERMRQFRDILMLEIDALKEKLTPITDVEKEQSPYPIMVCAGVNCSKVYKVGEEKKWHYEKICHRNCVETENSERGIIGNPALANCVQIDRLGKQCLNCGCDFSVHLLLDYETKLVVTYRPDESLDGNIAAKDEELKEIMQKIQFISMKNKQLKSERKSILGLCTQLAIFLKRHALISLNLSYKEYLLYLINIKQLEGSTTEDGEIINLQKRLDAFDETKKLFDEADKADININWDTNSEGYIEQRIRNLFYLSLNGPAIRRIFETESRSDNFIEDYIHTAVFKKKSAVADFKPNSDQKDKGGKKKRSEENKDDVNKGPQPPKKDLNNKTNQKAKGDNENNNNVNKEPKIKNDKVGNNQPKNKNDKVGENQPKSKNDKVGENQTKSKNNRVGENQPKSKNDKVGDNQQGKGVGPMKATGKNEPKNKSGKPGDKAPKNAPPKKKHVNNNKDRKELNDLTVEELRKILDEKVRLEKIDKNSKSRQDKKLANDGNKASGSSQSRQRTPPPPYTSEHSQPSYSNHNYQSQPSGFGYPHPHPAYAHPGPVHPHPGVAHAQPGSTHPPYYPPNYNPVSYVKPNASSDSDETLEIRVRIPKDKFLQGQAAAAQPPYYSAPPAYVPQPPYSNHPTHMPPYYPNAPYHNQQPYQPPPQYQNIPPLMPPRQPPPIPPRASSKAKNQNSQAEGKGNQSGFRGGKGAKPQFKPHKGNKKGGNNSDESDSS